MDLVAFSSATMSESAHQLVVATATAIASPDKQAEVLSDSSFALSVYPTFLSDMKTSKLRIKLAQVLGRIFIIDISLLPGHPFHPEELAIQLFLLGASLQPIIRSFKLLRKIKEYVYYWLLFGRNYLSLFDFLSFSLSLFLSHTSSISLFFLIPQPEYNATVKDVLLILMT